MRYLLVFMLLVGVFVLGKNTCTASFFSFGGVRGEGPIQTEIRSVSDFHAISLELAGDAEVTVAEQFSIEVQAQGNLLPLLKTVVEDGRLRIFFEGNVSHSQDVKVRVSAPAFDAFDIGGSGKITVVSPLKTDRLALEISGSGDLALPQTEVREIVCHIGGSGSVALGGTAGRLDVRIGGSGEVHAKELTAANCEAEISGAGTVTCGVSQTLRAHISGAGNVFYSGDPTVETHVSGAGSVKKI